MIETGQFSAFLVKVSGKVKQVVLLEIETWMKQTISL